MISKLGTSLLLLLGLILATGCAALLPINDRSAAADRVAAAAGFHKSYIKTGWFTLTAYERCKIPGDPLHIYIEGDGTAWQTRTRLADDPTPKSPLVLELAALDPSPNVAYLARPGQYSADGLPGCDAIYWSGKRFSNEVVDAMNNAIDVLRDRSKVKEIHLIGYSGGAAIAVLSASRRSDVISLRTVVGNLDPEAVNRYHGVSPLMHSLNPIDVAEKLRMPQRHFVGSADNVVPPAIAQSFLKRTDDQSCSAITVVEGATHTRGWREQWKVLLSMPFSCPGKSGK